MRSDVTEMNRSALEDFEKKNVFDLKNRRSDKNFKYFLKQQFQHLNAMAYQCLKQLNKADAVHKSGFLFGFFLQS